MKPRLLDLFCKAGGASKGYADAGFEVVGVDIEPQPHYPFEFHQANAMTFPLDGFQVIHASPPCQDHSTLKSLSGHHGTGWMLRVTLARLATFSGLYVVENVPGSGPSMGKQWTMLCGSSFDLGVRRHRLFTSNILILGLPCEHKKQGQPLGVYGWGGDSSKTKKGKKGNLAESSAAMGIDWMNQKEISQAIPPAYTKYIGEQLMEALCRLPST